MTDPRGRWFVSYKRENAESIRRLTHALHERGIPTWIDTENLASEPTHDAVRRAIRDVQTAGAVMFATPLVRTSETIRLVEAPEILGRWRADRTFGIVPIIAGGLDYADATGVYGAAIADHDLSLWNLHKADDEFTESDAAAIGKRILSSRISALHQTLPIDDPLQLAFHTRAGPAGGTNWSLNVDWSHRFDPRFCEPAIWSEHLLPALADIATNVCKNAPGRPVVAQGLASIPAAFALGSAFSTTLGVPMRWRQAAADSDGEEWSLEAQESSIDLAIHTDSRILAAKDMAVLVSVTGDVRSDFARTVSTLPALRCTVDVVLDQFSRRISRTEATAIARATSAAVREARQTYGATGTVHLFYAGPIGLTLMLGQLFNTFPAVATYEFRSNQNPPYRAAALVMTP